jgi:phosphatidylserine decarboxylase
MRLPIAKEGFMFLIPLGLLTAILWGFAFKWAALFFGGAFLFVTYFFRDPERVIPNDERLVVSPADGKVVEIVEEKDPILGQTFRRISIFLSVFNVHVNRMPIAGTVEKIKYNPGKFLAAFNPKASLDNEQNILLVNGNGGHVLVKQIAGLIARRIVWWVKENQKVARGERFGLIRFGSRVDVFVPLDTEIAVAIGAIVRGGSSIIGHLRGGKNNP